VLVASQFHENSTVSAAKPTVRATTMTPAPRNAYSFNLAALGLAARATSLSEWAIIAYARGGRAGAITDVRQAGTVSKAKGSKAELALASPQSPQITVV